jgi:hypothetical protein
MLVYRKVLFEVQSGDVFVHGLALANVNQGIALGMDDEPAGGIHMLARRVVEDGEVGELGDAAKGVGHEPLAVLREARDELVEVEDPSDITTPLMASSSLAGVLREGVMEVESRMIEAIMCALQLCPMR